MEHPWSNTCRLWWGSPTPVASRRRPRRIGTVQSNVSAHVARLERELEVPLVDRAAGRLTEEGEIVVARARRMLAELSAMRGRRRGHAPRGRRHGAGGDDRHHRTVARPPPLRPSYASATHGSR